LDDASVTPDQLGQLLKDRKTANPDFKAAVKADTDTPLGMFIKVYDAANFAGISDLQMFMNPIKSSETPGP
jgi:biopolymer transport protein ExbD